MNLPNIPAWLPDVAAYALIIAVGAAWWLA